jgi:hypothetical protein
VVARTDAVVVVFEAGGGGVGRAPAPRIGRTDTTATTITTTSAARTALRPPPANRWLEIIVCECPSA